MDDVCQLKQKQQFGIQCKKQQNANQVSETTNTTGLKINLDGKSLATFVSDDEDGVFSLITLPLKRELQRSARQGLGRGRRKGKNNCIHKLSCSEGSKELESLRIISNYIRRPCIGIKRHDSYKKIDSPYSLAKKTGSDLDLVCYADSIPEATVYWTRKNTIVSNSNVLNFTNLTKDHAGLYYCYAANSYDTKLSVIRLRIH